LDKYRVKDDQEEEEQQITNKPTGNRGGDDVLDKYRVKNEETGGDGGDGGESNWTIQLRNLSTEPGMPVQVLVNGSVILENEGQDGVVNLDTVVSPGIDIQLSIVVPAVNLNITRDVKTAQGNFIRLTLEPSGAKFKQQKQAFAD